MLIFADAVSFGLSQVELHLVEGLLFVPDHVHPLCQSDRLGSSFDALHKQWLKESFFECCYCSMLVMSPSCFAQEVLKLDDVVVCIAHFLPEVLDCSVCSFSPMVLQVGSPEVLRS